VVTTFSGGAARSRLTLTPIAGLDQGAEAAEGGAGALEGRRQLGVVSRLDVAHERRLRRRGVLGRRRV
jgi:hypothetical protein